MNQHDNPRQEIWELIQTDLKKLLIQAGKLHGHYCPFLAMGVKAGARGIKDLDLEHEGMEDVIAIVEANNCFSDGIQYSTGCTFGNNSMIYRDYGKTAVTLAKRDNEEGVRFSVKPESRENWGDKRSEYEELFDKVVKERTGDEQERKRMMDLSQEISFQIIEKDFEKLFKKERVKPDLPDYAPIFESITCSKCGESVMATRIVEKNDEKLCIPCAGEDYNQLDGRGISSQV